MTIYSRISEVVNGQLDISRAFDIVVRVSGIGNLNETSLHEQLKHHYAGDLGSTERSIGGFVIDVVLPGELVEIQTRGILKLRRKIESLRSSHRIRIVHPIAVETRIIKLTPGGELISSRKSPRKGRTEEVFRELSSVADLLLHRNVTVEVLLVTAIEIRSDDGKGSWRRQGVSIVERKLGEIRQITTLRTRRHYLSFIPASVGQCFTNSDLKDSLGAPYRLVQPITSTLRKMGLLSVVDHRGREQVYQVVPSRR